MVNLRGHLVLLLPVLLLVACARGEKEGAPTSSDPFGVAVDRVISQPNLKDQVDVLIDKWGIPHIYARNNHDAWYVQGYMAATDRFFQMDMARRLATGRLAEVIGEIPLLGSLLAKDVAQDIDLYYRTIFMGADARPIADALLETITPETNDVLQSFADGINAFMYDMITQRNGAHLPPVYGGIVSLAPYQLDPWTVRDTLAVLVVSMWSASNSVDQELALADYLGGLGPEKFTDFFRAQPDDPTTILPTGVNEVSSSSAPTTTNLAQVAATLAPALAAIRAAREAGDAANNDLFVQGQHSNCWGVDAAHSATGNTLLANDPHLGMLNPTYFWMVHVDSKTLGDGTLAYAGLGFPAAPGVQIGHNDAIGWTGTSAGYDTYDAYVETVDPNDEQAVMFDGESTKFRRPAARWEEFAIDLTGTHEKLRLPIKIVPQHGPVVPGSCRDGHCVSLRWTGATPGREIDAFLSILTATNLDEGLAALGKYRRGPYNWVVGDSTGRVGYLAAADVPLRIDWRNHPPYLPLPGSGGVEWSGFVPDAALAKLVDPENGFIVTANNDIYGTVQDNNVANDPYYFYWYADIGYRAGRVTDLLSGADGEADPNSLDLEDMRRIQFDNVSCLARRVLPHLFAAADARSDLVDYVLQGALDHLVAWDFTTPAAVPDRYRPLVPDEQTRAMSVAATLFHVWFGFAALDTFGDDFAKARLTLPGDGTESGPQFEARALLWLLEHDDEAAFGNQWWDDLNTTPVESKDEILIGALRNAVDYLSQSLGLVMNDWHWGRLHQGSFGLSFEGFTIPEEISPIIGPSPMDGGNFTVNVANTYGLGNEEEAFTAAHAPAGRMVMNLDGDRFESWAVLPGGQSERYDSTHFNDLFGNYLAGELVPVLFTIDEIVPVTVERIQFTPRR